MTRYTGFLSVHVAEALFLCLTSMKRLRRVPLASDQPTDWTPFVWRHCVSLIVRRVHRLAPRTLRGADVAHAPVLRAFEFAKSKMPTRLNIALISGPFFRAPQ